MTAPAAALPATPKPTDGVLLGLIGVVIFGLTLPMTRIAVAELDPVFVGIGRALISAALAVVFLVSLRQPIPERRHWRGLIITSAGLVFGFPIFATLAMVYAPASHGGVILAILPLATAAFSTILSGERPSGAFWFFNVLGSLAVFLFAWLDGAGKDGIHWADLLLLGAIICASFGYAQAGTLSRELGGWQVISWALLIGTPAVALTVWLFSGPINFAASINAWAAFAYLGAFSMFFGFFAWNAGLAKGGVAKIGQLQLLQPFVTLAAAAAIAGENITRVQLIFALVVVAIVVAGRKTHVSRIR